MFVDYVLNGQAFGAVAEQLAGCRFDPGLMRPYYDDKGHKCVTVNTGRIEYDKKEGIYKPVYENRLIADMVAHGIESPVFNATTLRKDEWLMMDRIVLRAARDRLRAWADLAAANTFGGFNGMSKMVLEHERMTDPGEAVVDMDGLTEGRGDTPRFQLEGLPLPITHSGFHFGSRRLAVSRNTGTPLDSTMAEAAGRRVAEMIEKVTIGVTDLSSLSYGNASDYGNTPAIYGYTNHPDRITKTDLTTPDGTNSDTVLAEVLAMRDLAYAQKFYGPFMLYHSTDWDQWLDNDYGVAAGTSYGYTPSQTLRQRLRQIEDIRDVRRLDFFTDTYSLLLVQMTGDVARAIDGMGITTVQWETRGGMMLNFKVMAIQVPQVRSQYIGTSTSTSKTGIVHGTTS